MTWDDLKADCAKMHNDMCVLYDTEIVRLVGCHDGEDDFYYIVRGFGRPKGDGTIHREWKASCVGWIYSLRGLIPDERYQQTDNCFALNGCGPEAAPIFSTDLGVAPKTMETK